ncbi:endo-1,4-beta-xylanase [Pseudobacteroides cellulosolvens]|nr:endo-1,4-beta-xylanase [Pseudobacteroides cellulosolvens]
MLNKVKAIISIIATFAILFSLFPVNVQAATTLTSNATGTIDGYNYEYWKDNGTGTMTLNGGGTFSCSWSNINNILFRTGKKLGSTKTYQEYGNISIDYSCNYQPNGNSYMAVYGWTENPLVEYYIIDSYGTWKPPGNGIQMKGTATVDGRTYEIYQNSRTGPSIKGDTTFQQYWSICTSKRTSGTISVSEHFKAWEAKGMKMGKMYEVSMVVEGYQSSGKADMTKMDLKIGPTPSNTNTQTNTPTPVKSSSTAVVGTDDPLRSLAQKIRAKGHEFYVGAAISGNLSGSDQNIVKTEFDIVTSENNMKIGAISPSQNQYNYSGGDSLVNFALSNNMIVHGHAFVWHKYNPGWVDGTKNMMETYISNVGNHYKGKIYAWDVVNEAFQKDGTYRINAIGTNGQDGASIFGQKQGKKYIEDAFIAARKADPNAKLVYNEYDMETRPAKFEGVYEMVKDFKSRNIPIDGVGFQMHLGPSFTETDAKRFADQMQKLADLGVESYVTEMDVGCPDTTQAGLEKQAQIYGWIAKACVEQPFCRAFQVWGIRDSQSWRVNPESPEDKAIAPLIFNDNGQKKPAYYAIQKAFADALNSTSPSKTAAPTATSTKPSTGPTIKGDINNDGIVNMADVLLLASAFNAANGSAKYNLAYDLNGDGVINMADVLIIASNFNKSGSIVAPGTPTNTITPTPLVSAGTKILPSVDSVEKDGPFSLAVEKNVGPNGKAWIVRPANLGSQGVTTHPIFIWGPGGGSDPSFYQDIMRRIASHGFVVYSESPSDSGAEMKAGIDWIIAQNNNSSSQYYKKLDTSRIAAGGHSLGSVASYGVASDPRITTTIHVDGGSLDGNGASKMRKPTALICGLADNLALENTRNDYNKATVPVWMGLMQGVDHGTGPKYALPATLAWLRWHLAGEAERKSMFIGSDAYFNTGIWQAQSKNW